MKHLQHKNLLALIRIDDMLLPYQWFNSCINPWLWKRVTVGRNCMKSTHSIHRHKSLSHELGSEWVSERANEWAQRSARTERAVRSKRMSERCERTSEQTSEWPSTLRIDFIVFQPTVTWYDDAISCYIRFRSLKLWWIPFSSEDEIVR